MDAYRRTGFAPSLNWYRNTRRNWDDERDVPMMVPHPALMVSAGRDRVLRPSLTEGMELYVPNLKRAVRPGSWRKEERGRTETQGGREGRGGRREGTAGWEAGDRRDLRGGH